MRKIYNDETHVLTGYSNYDGFVTTNYNTSWEVTSIELNLAALWTSVTATSYTYADSYGDTYTYSVDANGVVIGYTAQYASSAYIYSYDATGNLLSFSYSDGVTTTVYNPDGTVNEALSTTDTSAFVDPDGEYTSTDDWGNVTTYYLQAGQVTHYTTASSYFDSGSGNTYTSTYDYAPDGSFLGYAYSDGTTIWSYDANWNYLGAAIDLSNPDLIPIDGGYKLTQTDSSGDFITYSDTAGKVNGYEYVTTWDIYTYTYTYDENWNILRSETRDANGVVNSSIYHYNADTGAFDGYENTDGTTTWYYNADWTFDHSSVDAGSLTDLGGGKYGSTDAWGTTTIYDGNTASASIVGYSNESEYVSGTDTYHYTYTYDKNWNFLTSKTTLNGVMTYSSEYFYLYDANGNATFDGYEYFDGTTTWTYDENWNLTGTQFTGTLLHNDTDGWYYTSGDTTTYYGDAAGTTVTGYRYEYDWDGYTYTYRYDENWNLLNSETRDVAGVVNSSNYLYDDVTGAFEGYSYFDGTTTWYYNADWSFDHSSVDGSNLTDLGGGKYGFTDAWGTTTIYDSNTAEARVVGYSNESEYVSGTDTYHYTYTYDKNWNFLTSETTLNGVVTYSSEYFYLYDVDGNATFNGYEYFDGTTTWTYDANWNLLGSVADTTNMIAVDANWNEIPVDDTTTPVAAYKSNDNWGTSTYYDPITGIKVGYSTSWEDIDSSDGYTSTSTTFYDDDWGWTGSEYSSTDSSNHTSSSSSHRETLKTDGVITGYIESGDWTDGTSSSSYHYEYDANWNFLEGTSTYGAVTTVYGANWAIISQAANVTGMDPVFDTDGTTVIGYKTTESWSESSSTTTYYDLTGNKTGYSTTWLDTDSSDGWTSESTTFYDDDWGWTGSEYNSHDISNSTSSSSSSHRETLKTGDTITGYIESGDWTDGTNSSSYHYEYDANWNFLEGTSTYGAVTTVYGANWAIISQAANVTGMDPVFDTDGTTVIGYKTTESWSESSSTTTYYDLTGNKTGYSTTWLDTDSSDGWTSESTTFYDDDWGWTGSEYNSHDISNSTSSSSSSHRETLKTDGVITGYIESGDWTDSTNSSSYHYEYDANWNFLEGTSTYGAVTTVYGANWVILSQAAETTGMDPVFDTDGTTVIGYKTTESWSESSSTTTYYDLTGNKTGYSTTWLDTDSSDGWTSESTTFYDDDWSWTGSAYSSHDINNSTSSSSSSHRETLKTNGVITGYIENGESGNWLDGATPTPSMSSYHYEYDANWNFVSGTSTYNGTTTTYGANWVVVSQVAETGDMTPIDVNWDELTGELVDTDSDGVDDRTRAYKTTEVWNESSTSTYYDLDGNKIGYSTTWTYNGDAGYWSTNTSFYDANWNPTGSSDYLDSNGNSSSSSRTVEEVTFDFDGNPDTPDTTQEVRVERGESIWIRTDPEGVVHTETSSFEHYYVNDSGWTHLGGQNTYNGVTTKHDANWNMIGGNTGDTTAPQLMSTIVSNDGMHVTLFFDDLLDATVTPLSGYFTVSVDGTSAQISSLSVFGGEQIPMHQMGGTVTLSMAMAIPQGAVVTVSYADPSGVDDGTHGLLQNASGIDAGNFLATDVINNSTAGGGTTEPNTFTVTPDTNTQQGDTLIGTFSPFQGATGYLHDTDLNGNIDQLVMAGTGPMEQWSDTYKLEWVGTNWTGYRVETITFGTEYDLSGRPTSVVSDSGPPQTIDWLTTPDGEVIGRLSFTETWGNGTTTSTHTLNIALLNKDGDPEPDQIQVVTDAATAAAQTELLEIVGWTFDGSNRPTSMTTKAISDTSGDGVISGSATFDVSNQIQTITLSLPDQGGGGNTGGDAIAGDASTTASILAAGSQSGTIDTSGDRDWYAVQLTAGESYTFTLNSADGVLDPVLSLYNANSNLLARSDDYDLDYYDTIDGSGSRIDFSAATGGTYYLGAGGYSLGTGSYTLTSALSTGVVDTVLANPFTTAALSVPGTLAGNLDFADDQDWYRVHLEAGNTYAFTESSVAFDSYLGLYAANGQLAASNDDNADPSYAGTDSRIVFTPSSSGDYYLAAGNGYHETGAYTLGAELVGGGGTGGDTTAPTLERASFNEAGANTISLTFSEAIVLPAQIHNLSIFKNPDPDNTSGQGETFTAQISAADPKTLVLTVGTTLGPNDEVRVQYWGEYWGGNPIADVAGNLLEPGEIWLGGSANNAINLGDYGSWLPIMIRGGGGDDVLTATDASDKLVDGIGADRLIGGGGEDHFVLVEDGGARPFSRDVIQISAPNDGMSGVVIQASVVTGLLDAPGSGFDISSSVVGNHDVLSLPSAIIAADVTNAAHSISGGIITLGSAATIGDLSLNDVVTYLHLNFPAVGTTAALKFDSDGNDAVDSLLVFQAGGSHAPDTVVVLKNLVGIDSAVLGTTAGANVVQLVDEQGPQVMSLTYNPTSITLGFNENATVDVNNLAFTMLKNGADPVTFTGITGNGTTSLTLETSSPFAATDWWMGSYNPTSVAEGFADVEGNYMQGDGPGYWIEGLDGDNTINLSGGAFTQPGYEVMANGGNDSVIGSASDDWIEGGAGNDTLAGGAGADDIEGSTGADTLTGGAGTDWFGFVQGDSPTLTFVESSGGTPFLDFGDTFVFSGGADIITDFSSGDGLNLQSDVTGAPGIGMMNGDPNMLYKPNNGQATDQGFFMIRGNYSNGVFSVDGSTNGHDTLVVYDGDSSASVVQTGLVLSGVGAWWDQVAYFVGSNSITHLP